MGRFLRAVVGCSGYGWADNSVGVGVCCVRRFLRTAGGPVAWPVLGTVGGCCGGILRAVGPEGLLWSACSVGVRLVGWRIFCAQVGAYFRVRLGPGGVACILCAASGFPVCYEVDSSPLFNFNRIFPPSPERAETLRRNLLFEGTMLMPSDLGLCYFMRGP